MQSETELNSRPHTSKALGGGQRVQRERAGVGEGLRRSHSIAQLRDTWDQHHSPVNYVTEGTVGGPGLRLFGEKT